MAVVAAVTLSDGFVADAGLPPPPPPELLPLLLISPLPPVVEGEKVPDCASFGDAAQACVGGAVGFGRLNPNFPFSETAAGGNMSSHRLPGGSHRLIVWVKSSLTPEEKNQEEEDVFCLLFFMAVASASAETFFK